ncbi:Probable ubiquinone biosynthesis protein UbiB [Serratia quinivorans]|uniref:ABC1 kinase family protein n=1 Tax=Serratia quinivorans TaxID=137545 RepID=UPI0021791B79|nr:AarF/UbiB family protein [Serratia quinivorans]CAI1541648.1 Probable ubiquinone biosynthesis protein UbiB [Serratia quinivorans]CAI1642178.1 Probable ubiquinone biosynthesis protein UbiB [Serratia quinivorans]CAI2029900.1 Probable ubiquinone biosynthesis protein UbiB [Serratia quinivorans]CAI2072472.1 Probable ubiquinone biosynthesis protein UbiB [Serratia quinivorans]CAI2394679.1 Probable ubiquinone biosynthesis protein UbiB [Serratia quinivorans]
MLKMVLVTARDRARLKEISAVLIRYGLQDVIRLLGLSTLLSGGESGGEPQDNQTLPQRLRAALEALGPTFVKFGQILATRSDLLDSSWTDELDRLHSQATTLAWSELAPQITADLGDDPHRLFAEFDEAPLAAASMAQIYRARLHSGEAVVIKVLRPGLAKTIHADLRLLAYLAETVKQQSPALARYRPRQMVRALATALNHELDLTHEGNNCERVAEQFAQQPEVVIPKIYWQWSSKRLLVQEFLPGIAPENPQQLATAGFDGPLLAQRGAQAFMKMVLEHRLYHADPHPGNVMALADNRVGFIDFGMVGQLSERRRNQLLLLLQAIAERESGGIVNTLIAWSDSDPLDLLDLELAAQNFLDKQASATLTLGKALTDLLVMAREHQLALPPDLVLLFKALITADGVLHRLDPHFDIIATLKPMLQQVMLQRYTPEAVRRRMLALGGEALDAGEELPQTLRLLMRRLKRGQISADINLKNISQLSQALERAAVTLAIAIVTAAFTLGLAPYLMQSSVRLWGIPLFPALGALACLGGVLLLALRLRR